MPIQRKFIHRIQVPLEQLTNPREPEFYEIGDNVWELDDEDAPAGKVKVLALGGPMFVERADLSERVGW